MFSGRYNQMFFPLKLKLEGNLSPNEYVAYPWFPVLTYASKYCNLSPVTTTENAVQHSTHASIWRNAIRHRISAKKKHEKNDLNGKKRSRRPFKALRKIPLQTYQIEKRNE